MYNNMPNQNDNNSYGGNGNPSMSDYNSNNMSDTSNSYTPNNSMPNSSNGYAPNNNPHPIDNSVVNIGAPKNKKTMMIIVAVVAILAIVGIYFIVKSIIPNKTNTGIGYKEKLEKESAEIIKNISTDVVKLASGDYLIILNNKNSKPINAECTAELYNNDTVTYTEEVYFGSYIMPNSRGYAVLYANDIKGYTFDKIVPKISSYYHIFKTYDGQISHTEEVKNNSLVVAVKNNSSDKISSATIEALFYDSNDNIIGYSIDYLSNNLTSGSTNFGTLSLPRDDQYDDIPFSRYEVIVSAEENF